MKKKLTSMQNYVINQKGTEPAFNNEYWNNKEDGIYVDVISNRPLFLSIHKFDSGTGWPSFTRPIKNDDVGYADDYKIGYKRIEVHSKDGTHLGHLFQNCPTSPTGNRYCLNSASLKFIPKEQMEIKGFGKYLKYFN